MHLEIFNKKSSEATNKQERQNSTREGLNFADPSFESKKLSISEFPCYDSQRSLNVFVAYAIISNLRTFFVPCVDCSKCFQKQKAKENLCRYPSAKFYERVDGEQGVKSLG